MRESRRDSDESGLDPEAGMGSPAASDADPPAGAPQTLPEALARLAALAGEVAELRAELEQARDRALRERADLENFKRRMQRDKSEALRYANEGLLRDLLPVVDNLERAVRAAREAAPAAHGDAGAPAGLLTGVELVLGQFHDVLGRYGVARIAAAGQPFDPARHEAIAQIESHEHPAGTVVDEHATGYHLHDRLLRATQVSVAKAPASPAPGTPGRGVAGGD